MNKNDNPATWLNRVASILDKSNPVIRWLSFIGAGVFFVMVCATFVDVFLRYLFNRPIKATVDITQLLLVIVVFLGVAFTQHEKGHVAIDLITSKLRPAAHLVMDTMTTLLSFGLFGVLIWQSILQLLRFIKMGAHAEMVPIPVPPFAALIPLGCTLLLIVLLRDLLRNIDEGLRLKLRGYQWLLMFGIPVLVMVWAVFWMQPTLWTLSLPVVGVIGVVLCVVLFLVGMPISFVLIMIGILFMSHIRGPVAGLSIAGVELYRSTAHYVWAAVAFFVLMGYFCLFARLGEDLYFAAYKWLGRLPGGLAIATVAACTAFAAIVGEMIAATVTFTATALPEMRKYDYSDRLATGVISAGATLGPLIPPSVTFIMYGVLTGVSIGKLFVAGIFPGLLISLSFMAIVYIRCRLDPKLGPPGLGSTWGDRLVSLKAGGPIAILFILVIGGIYAGAFTPCEGGGIGAVGALVIGLAMRRFTWQSFANALRGAGKIIAMVFLMIAGGTMFTRFLVSCNLPNLLMRFFTELPVSPMIVIIAIVFTFLVLGCFIESMPLLLIGVPLFHPIAVALGFDPIWFAVLLAIMIHLGMITPPVGVILFALKGVEKDIPIATIYRGVIPFVLATLLATAIIMAFPKIATWLPSLLK
jgi:tripartite ATP-independent transporter DctM subunit